MPSHGGHRSGERSGRAKKRGHQGSSLVCLHCQESAAFKACLHAFIHEAIEPGSTVRTDGWPAYLGLTGYEHDRQIQRRQRQGVHLLPRVHRVVSLLKRGLIGTHQGAVGHEYLNSSLDEFTFRFNRRTSKSRGKRFYRLAQQAVQVAPVSFESLTHPQPLGGG